MSSSACVADQSLLGCESERSSPDNRPLIKRRRVRRDDTDGGSMVNFSSSDLGVADLALGRSAAGPSKSHEELRQRKKTRVRSDVPKDGYGDEASTSHGFQDLGPSWSSDESLSDMMDFLNPPSDVNYYLPRPVDRPWRAHPGCICLYESYFRECGLRFPIPRFVQSFCERREVAISQLSVGSVRNMSGLKILADRCGVKVTARLLEELVSFREQKDQPGVFYTSAVRKYPLVTGFDRKIRDWNRSFFFVKVDEGSVEDPSVRCLASWNLAYGRSLNRRIFQFIAYFTGVFSFLIFLFSFCCLVFGSSNC